MYIYPVVPSKFLLILPIQVQDCRLFISSYLIYVFPVSNVWNLSSQGHFELFFFCNGTFMFRFSLYLGLFVCVCVYFTFSFRYTVHWLRIYKVYEMIPSCYYITADCVLYAVLHIPLTVY